jgi:mannose-6-phosphate isomerase-like protein (cupin superfamily)
MVKAVDIKATLEPLPVLHGRTPHTPDEESDKAFATLADYRDGGIFAGSFDGHSEWERHRNGDELVHVLGGETTMTILTDDGPVELTLTAGMLTVVPQGLWHRFHAPDGVTLMTVTPQPTDHSTADDPRDD